MHIDEEKIKKKGSLTSVLHSVSGSPRDRVLGGAESDKRGARIRAAIGYAIAAAFIFAAIALLLTLISEAGRFVSESDKSDSKPKEYLEAVFIPKGSKPVVGGDGKIQSQKVSGEQAQSAAQTVKEIQKIESSSDKK